MDDQLSRLKERLGTGVLPAMVTPLDHTGYRVAREAVAPLVDFLIDAGVSGLFAGGTTGEGLLLDVEERCALHEAAYSAAAGRVPLLVHVGTNITRDTMHLVAHAAGLGVDGIVCITPTFYGMPDEDLLRYFVEVASGAPDMPFLVYDIPHMAATGVSPALLARLSDTIANFAGVKCSRPDAQVIRQLIDTAADRALIFAGNERIALGSLALGASGLISGLATAIPEPFVALTSAVSRGDQQQALIEQRRINRLLDRIPAPRRIGALKRVLEQRGLPVGPMVPPRTVPDDARLWADLSALL